MKTKALLLFLCAAQLFCGLAFAQSTYHAGFGSGTKGGYNVFVGYYAGYNTTSSGNSFVGSGAGENNQTGYSNSFLGSDAGHANLTGAYNSFLGSDAGLFNIEGTANSYVGSSAGYSNSKGSNNSFLGYQAGYYNWANNNSFLGYQAGYNNQSAHDNSFLGYQAGYNNTGSNNSFVGSQAGLLNMASNNSFLGRSAGYNNIYGYSNSFLGSYAGYANKDGYANSFIGTNAGQANITGHHNSFIGYQTGYNNSASFNSFLGSNAGFSNTSGAGNTFLGTNAGTKNTTGSFNLFLGAFANASASNFSYVGAIGYRAYVTAANSLVLGSINGVNGATVSTKVGIGTTAPGYLLHVNGTAAKPGGGSWTVASDQRLKQDVSEFKDGLEQLEKIRPVWFRYNGRAGLPTDKKYVGVIAQEMQQIAPYTIGEFIYQDSTGKQEKYLDYDANAVTYMLVNSVKEQQTQIQEQQSQLQQQQKQGEQKDLRIATLETQVATLTSELSAIKALLIKQHLLTPNAENGAARLWQNQPNPTDGTTTIRYYIPQEATSAQIKVVSANGHELQSYNLTERGEGQLTLAAGSLASGTYVYHLVVDSQHIDAKKLVLTR